MKPAEELYELILGNLERMTPGEIIDLVIAPWLMRRERGMKGLLPDDRPIPAPYFVEVDRPGCERCQQDRTYGVVAPDGTPDGVLLGTSYGNDEDAKWLAQQLNEAYRAGWRAGKVA